MGAAASAAGGRSSAPGWWSCSCSCWSSARCTRSGSWGEDDPGGEREANTVETPTPTPKSKSKRKKKRAEPTRVTLQIVPTGLVSVCLVDANGRALIDNRALAPGDATRRYRGKRFRVSFGNGQARMRTGGRTIDVPDRSTPVGYEVRPGRRPRELSEARRPTCT